MQFIYGRDLSKKIPIYEVVDCSLNFDLKTLHKYYPKFDKIRTGEILFSSSVDVFFASKTYDGELIIGRFARSLDEEIGRNYYLQEHYLIFPKSEVDKWGGKLLFFLHSIPIPKTYYSVSNNLKSQLYINKEDFSNRRYFKLIYSIDIDNRYELITAIINSLLQGEETLVILEDLFYKAKWDLINLVLAIVPINSWLKNGLFIGPHYPKEWDPDLTFLPLGNPAKEISKINVKNYNSFENSSNDFFNFSNLFIKCLQYNRVDLAIILKDYFCETSKKISSTNDNQYQGSKECLPSEIITQIVVLIIINEGVSTNDLFWYWRNGSIYLDSESIGIIFPIIAQHFSQWNSKDFQIINQLLLAKNINLELLINQHIFSKSDYFEDFVYGLLINNSNFNEIQIIFIFEMLTLLLNFNADQVLIFLSELLRKIIDSKYLLNVYYLLMKIPSSTICRSESTKSIFFFCTLMCKTNSKKDIYVLYKIAHTLQRNSIIFFCYQLLFRINTKKTKRTIVDEYDLLFYRFSESYRPQSEDFIILFHISFITRNTNLFLCVSKLYWSTCNPSRESIFQSIYKYQLADFSWLTDQIKIKPIIGTYLLLFLHQSYSKIYFSEIFTQILVYYPINFPEIINYYKSFNSISELDFKINQKYLSDASSLEHLNIINNLISYVSIYHLSNFEENLLIKACNSILIDHISLESLIVFNNYFSINEPKNFDIFIRINELLFIKYLLIKDYLKCRNILKKIRKTLFNNEIYPYKQRHNIKNEILRKFINLVDEEKNSIIIHFFFNKEIAVRGIHTGKAPDFFIELYNEINENPFHKFYLMKYLLNQANKKAYLWEEK